MSRGWTVHENLNVEVQKVMRALDRLDRLEQALEGKYLDFRLSPSLESLNFVFDRTSGDAGALQVGGQAGAAAGARAGADVRLRAAAARSPRVLSPDHRRRAAGQVHARRSADRRSCASTRAKGYSHPPDYRTTEREIDGHRNFAIDFKAPEDVVTINDLRVSLRSSQPIRSAILYVRGRLMPGAASGAEPGAATGGSRESIDRPPPREEPAQPLRRRSRLDEAPSAEPPEPSPTQGPRRRLS